MNRSSWDEWQKEMAIVCTAPLCDIEAGYHGPIAELLCEQWAGVRRAMLESLCQRMHEHGFPALQVLDAARAAMGFKA